jgi:cobalt-zinc-cadmium resistance protein CzcA
VIVGGMLLSPICSLLVIPMLARMFMPYVPGTIPGHETPSARAERAEEHAPAGS